MVVPCRRSGLCRRDHLARERLAGERKVDDSGRAGQDHENLVDVAMHERRALTKDGFEFS
jgi:hypothetical protein